MTAEEHEAIDVDGPRPEQGVSLQPSSHPLGADVGPQPGQRDVRLELALIRGEAGRDQCAVDLVVEELQRLRPADAGPETRRLARRAEIADAVEAQVEAGGDRQTGRAHV